MSRISDGSTIGTIGGEIGLSRISDGCEKIFQDSFSGLFQDPVEMTLLLSGEDRTPRNTQKIEYMQIWINKYANMSTFSDHSNDDEGCENTDTI